MCFVFIFWLIVLHRDKLSIDLFSESPVAAPARRSGFTRRRRTLPSQRLQGIKHWRIQTPYTGCLRDFVLQLIMPG